MMEGHAAHHGGGDADVEFDPSENDENANGKGSNGGVRRLNLVRGYTLLFVGCGLVIYSFVGGLHPGALTLGGALIGFNPLFRATVNGKHG